MAYKSGSRNNPPYQPTIPSGPTSGEPGESYTYYSTIDDLEYDPIYCVFDWGDGTDSGWLGSYNSGRTVRAAHDWSAKGNFELKVKAKDIHGEESSWSEPLKVNVQKSETHTRHLLMYFFETLPNILKLFQYLRGL